MTCAFRYLQCGEQRRCSYLFDQQLSHFNIARCIVMLNVPAFSSVATKKLVEALLPLLITGTRLSPWILDNAMNHCAVSSDRRTPGQPTRTFAVSGPTIPIRWT